MLSYEISEGVSGINYNKKRITEVQSYSVIFVAELINSTYL